MQENFQLKIESMYVQDKIDEENVSITVTMLSLMICGCFFVWYC